MLIKRYYASSHLKIRGLEKLPAKSTRWGIFTAAGLGIDLTWRGEAIGTAISTALGASRYICPRQADRRMEATPFCLRGN